MFARRSAQRLRDVFIALGSAICVLALMNRPPMTAQAAGNTYVVNSTADTVDADVGDPACADSTGHCTLRAAIMQANFATGLDTITLPSGVYVLTRPGDDDVAVLGDLDLADDLTIQGAGSGTTIVDGNGAVTGDRVFQILAGAKDVTLSGLTIRAGKKISNTFDVGGGLYWTGGGGHLHLSDLSVEGNAARYGGGIYLDYADDGGDVTLDNLILRANTATTGAGGGLVVALNGHFAMRNSQVYSNTAFQGGGISLQSTLKPFSIYSATIAGSQIYSNTANAHGAGIYNGSGNADNPLLLIDSYLHHNRSAGLGGAIENNGGLSILRSTLDTNFAATQGGGIYNDVYGMLELTQSTLSANTAQFGGGLFIESFMYTRTPALASVVNSTISGNTASHEGAGLYADGGQAQFYNATIAANQIVVPVGNFYPAMGAGLLITSNLGIGTSAVITLQNTLIGDNSLRVGIDAPVPDDCYGRVRAQGYNLIETLAHCAFEYPSIGDITGQDPKLGPLQLNGGSTATQALLPGSPAIDAGRPTGCANEFGQILNIDQRGWSRPIGVSCDIGAVEYSPYAIDLPLIMR